MAIPERLSRGGMTARLGQTPIERGMAIRTCANNEVSQELTVVEVDIEDEDKDTTVFNANMAPTKFSPGNHQGPSPYMPSKSQSYTEGGTSLQDGFMYTQPPPRSTTLSYRITFTANIWCFQLWTILNGTSEHFTTDEPTSIAD